MTPEEQVRLMQGIDYSQDDHWKPMLRAAITGLTDQTALEQAGCFLKAKGFLYLLMHKKEIQGANQNKISPLLVGMPNEVFSEILSYPSDDEISLLKQEAATEPLQHQLTLFSHDMIYKLDVLTDKLRDVEREIDTVDRRHVTYRILESYYSVFDKLRSEISIEIQKINNALALSWNSSRSDLIESLSFLKECRQKYRTYVIGLPPTENESASGFYARLISRLNEVFTGGREPSRIEALQDDEPAIEALAKFSLWYLQDYMELGILRKTLSELDLNNLQYSDLERAEYRLSLYKETERSLAAIGLSTVKDLKEKQIFSKEILKEYIQRNKAKF